MDRTPEAVPIVFARVDFLICRPEQGEPTITRGWRAGETWFYAYLMGWPRIAVYDGGWFEWSQDPVSNPIEVGEPVAV